MDFPNITAEGLWLSTVCRWYAGLPSCRLLPLETAAFPFFKDIFSLFIWSLRTDQSLGPDTGFLRIWAQKKPRSVTCSRCARVHSRCPVADATHRRSLQQGLPACPCVSAVKSKDCAVGRLKPPRQNICRNVLQINKQPVMGPFHAFLGFLRTAILILKRHQ